MHRFLLTAHVPSVRVSVSCCTLSSPLVREMLSEVERKGNPEIGAGLGHCPSVSWETQMRPFLQEKGRVALNEE